MTDDLLANFRSGTPTTRQSPFGYTGDDPSQLFADLGQGINPSGFVSNVDNAPANVIINENGITVIDGAIVVENAGAVVIIDGTSDMFKIAATGTFSLAGPNGKASVSTSVTLSSLGTFSTARTVASMIRIDSSSQQRPSIWVDEADVGDISWVIGRRAEITSSLNGSNEEVVVFRITGYTTTNWSAVTSEARYYVLQEAAI